MPQIWLFTMCILSMIVSVLQALSITRTVKVARKREDAATEIQASYRRKAAWILAGRKREESQAATKIQKVYRLKKARPA